ncbi:MAG: YidC/Oxa1 family membrane protein insertase [Butyricicoccus sp.]
MSWITAIFAWPLKEFYNLTNNYGIAIMLFAVLVNLVLLPFMAKSKKSMMRTTRLQPRLKELEKKYNGNPQQYQQAVSKLYREEKINPMSGCLWSLLPFPILIALYSVIRQPLSKMMNLSAEAVTSLTEWVTNNAGFVASAKPAYTEIEVMNSIHQNWDAVTAALGDFSGKLMDLDYSFLGLNLGQQPSIKFWEFDWSNNAAWLPALGLFLIPIISAFLSWLSMKISTMTTPQVDKQQAQTNKSMMLVMPLVSLWICFTMPAALGVYWILNSVCGIVRDVVLTKIYTKQLDLADLNRADRQKELEIERRREETERMRAAGETTKNPNTSKKKIQANQKQQDDERKAALEREERAAKRERLGIKETEQPASQVGNRRYARGRAYAPDRFGEAFEAAVDAAPEGAEESAE